jgi:hypothetical protein
MAEAIFDELAPEKAINRPRLCEESGGHRVHVKEWPPRARHPSSKRPPHLDTKCERCGCHLSIYDPPQPGINIVKPPEPRLTGQKGG